MHMTDLDYSQRTASAQALWRAGEMAQPMRALDALLDDLDYPFMIQEDPGGILMSKTNLSGPSTDPREKMLALQGKEMIKTSGD